MDLYVLNAEQLLICLKKGGKKLAEKYKINFLGSIPMDPDIGTACDNGTPFVHKYAKSETAKIIEKVIDPILELSI